MAESKLAVFGAIAANVTIATMKFVGAGATGSSAMLSEGIHSLVDSGDGLLLLVGMRLADRPPDERHPFGHGKELYFWSLIVAVLIFGVGGGVSIYEGILRLLDPQPMENAGWSYAILAGAAVFEGTSLTIAVRQFKRSIGDAPFWESLRTSKDPTLYTVMAEDSAALAGLAAAAIGVFGSDSLGMPAFDAERRSSSARCCAASRRCSSPRRESSSSARRSTARRPRRSARSRRASRACTAPAGR